MFKNTPLKQAFPRTIFITFNANLVLLRLTAANSLSGTLCVLLYAHRLPRLNMQLFFLLLLLLLRFLYSFVFLYNNAAATWIGLQLDCILYHCMSNVANYEIRTTNSNKQCNVSTYLRLRAAPETSDSNVVFYSIWSLLLLTQLYSLPALGRPPYRHTRTYTFVVSFTIFIKEIFSKLRLKELNLRKNNNF